MPFSKCGWEPVLTLSTMFPENTEVFIWQVDDGWSQEAFDEAYNEALSDFNIEEIESEDTGSFDTGTDSRLSNGLDVHLTRVQDLRFALNPEHDLFYAVMQTFSRSIGYRIYEDGELVPVFYPNDIEPFIGANLHFPTACEEQVSDFVITVLGESVESSMDIDLLRHEGVSVTRETLSCGRKRN